MLALLFGHFGIAGAKLGKIEVWWGDFFGGWGIVVVGINVDGEIIYFL
jgi:hypothetical protein